MFKLFRKKYRFFSLVSYTFEWWVWTIEITHRKRYKTKSDYKELRDYIRESIKQEDKIKLNVLITNIITFKNI